MQPSRYRRSYKGPQHRQPPPCRHLLFCIALFIFPGVITVRHQRSWCGAAALSCIFSNVSSDTRLCQSFIFATYIALVKNKKRSRTRERDVDGGPGCKELYRRPRMPLQRTMGSRYFITMRSTRYLRHSRKERSALNLSVHGTVWERSLNDRINRCLLTFSRWFFFIQYAKFIYGKIIKNMWLMSLTITQMHKIMIIMLNKKIDSNKNQYIKVK